jgi:hypothetical protein
MLHVQNNSAGVGFPAGGVGSAIADCQDQAASGSGARRLEPLWDRTRAVLLSAAGAKATLPGTAAPP